MSRYVNERLANYVPVSQYMGTLGMTQTEKVEEASWAMANCSPYCDKLSAKEPFYAQKGYALGVAVGAVGALVLSMVYKKSKGK
jgi:hypothetical protein